MDTFIPMNSGIRDTILREAEFLIRTRGYSAFSYADIAEIAGIRKASIHYYFPTKENMVIVLVQEYVERAGVILEEIKLRHGGVGERLRAYAAIFLDGFEKGMLPLCGALSAERSALPLAMRPQISSFFQSQLDWMADVVQKGREAGEVHSGVQPDQAALLLLSALEGGSFIGWALEQKAHVLPAFEATLRSIEARRADECARAD